MKETKNLTKKLVESSLMIAFATVLSICKILEMPYGGSVTVASMLPILIVAYRHGIGMGLASGLVYSVIQQLLGLNNLSYVSGWQSVVAVMLLDYILAFTVIGLGGIFKDRLGLDKNNMAKKQSIELGTGMAFVCVLRYACHTVAGATVWAGLSIPTEAAFIYSLGYNATYMIPETIVNVFSAVWIGEVIDLFKKIPTRMKKQTKESSIAAVAYVLNPISKLLAALTVIIDALLVFAHLQNPDDGRFTFEFISEVNWIAFAIVSSLGILLSAGCYIASKYLLRKQK